MHRGQFKPSELGPYPLAFLIVRHPVARLISCYRYFSAGGLNAHPSDRFFPGDHAAQRFLEQLAPSLEQCCDQLPQIAAQLPHFQPMTFWLDAPSPPLGRSRLHRTAERFDADLQMLFDQLQLPLDPALLQCTNSSRLAQALLSFMPSSSLTGGESELSTGALAQLQVVLRKIFVASITA